MICFATEGQRRLLGLVQDVHAALDKNQFSHKLIRSISQCCVAQCHGVVPGSGADRGTVAFNKPAPEVEQTQMQAGYDAK